MPNCFEPKSYQIKNVEELNKAIYFLYNVLHERHAILKSQAKRLKFKSPPSSAKSKAAASAAPPSSQVIFLFAQWNLAFL